MPRAYLVRHAKAGDRYKFPGPDRDRPLTPAGRSQAEHIALRIAEADDAPVRVLSSPAVRCVQTVEPLAAKLGVGIEVVDWLDEGADVDDAYRLIGIGSREETIAACTHGDVMWGVLECLARGGVDLGERPDAAKGGTWVLEWPDGATSDPSKATYLAPPPKIGPVSAGGDRRT